MLQVFGGAWTRASVEFQVCELFPRMLEPHPVGFHVCFLTNTAAVPSEMGDHKPGRSGQVERADRDLNLSGGF